MEVNNNFSNFIQSFFCVNIYTYGSGEISFSYMHTRRGLPPAKNFILEKNKRSQYVATTDNVNISFIRSTMELNLRLILMTYVMCDKSICV